MVVGALRAGTLSGPDILAPRLGRMWRVAVSVTGLG
jgi:hypothetical protein